LSTTAGSTNAVCVSLEQQNMRRFPLYAEASRAVRQAEVGAAKTMIERAEERFDLKPQY